MASASADPGVPAHRIEVAVDPGVRQRLDIRWVIDHVARAAELLPRAVAHIDLLIVDDRRMGVIHERHLSDPATTDVLSFNLADESEPIDAQLVICADAAAREAGGRGHTVEREVLLYAVHGLLHCAGFDDQTKAGAAAMHAEEDWILSEIGLGRVFGGDCQGP